MDTKITVNAFNTMREITESLDIGTHANEIILMIERLLPKLDEDYAELLHDTCGFVRPEDEPKTEVHKIMMACYSLLLELNGSNLGEDEIMFNQVCFQNYNGRFNING